jgi:hypothetical protein
VVQNYARDPEPAHLPAGHPTIQEGWVVLRITNKKRKKTRVENFGGKQIFHFLSKKRNAQLEGAKIEAECRKDGRGQE